MSFDSRYQHFGETYCHHLLGKKASLEGEKNGKAIVKEEEGSGLWAN
jgi:hypothetical protein